jgi:predicted Zn-dependent peptidase
VVVAPVDYLHTASVSLVVRAGSRYESPRNNGVSHFFEHMLFRGTSGHPSAHELNLAIEELGGTFQGSTYVDFTTYDTALPPENVQGGIELLGEMVGAPLFQDIDVEKRIIREEILEGLDDDERDVDIDNVARATMFPGHPLGYKITGPLQNVESFRMEDLTEHQRTFYGAQNMVLCVAGAVTPEPVVRSAHDALGSLPAGRRVPIASPDSDADPQRFVYVYDQGSQTDLRLSFPTFGMRDPRHGALKLLVRLLDDGMSARLHRRICDELGLAYEAFASLDPYEDCGALDFGASVAHDKVPEVLHELLQLAVELRDGEIGNGELERVRNRYLWSLQAMLDDADGLALYFGTTELFELEHSLERTADAIRRVSASDIREVARAVLNPDRAQAACVGVLSEDLQRRARSVLPGA